MAYEPDIACCEVIRTDIKSNVLKAFEPTNLTTVERDALVSPAAGSVIWNTTTTLLEVFNGIGWDTFVKV